MNEAVDNNAPINQGVDMYGRQKPDLLSPRECAIIAAQAANEKKATDIMVQQVGDLIGVTEYFVICTASNNRQVDAVVGNFSTASEALLRIRSSKICPKRIKKMIKPAASKYTG